MANLKKSKKSKKSKSKAARDSSIAIKNKIYINIRKELARDTAKLTSTMPSSSLPTIVQIPSQSDSMQEILLKLKNIEEEANRQKIAYTSLPTSRTGLDPVDLSAIPTGYRFTPHNLSPTSASVSTPASPILSGIQRPTRLKSSGLSTVSERTTT